MARRLFNGRKFSEDGWPYVDADGCTWIVVPGTNVHLQIQSGPPAAILGAAAADFNAFVEPLRDPDSACWTPGNSVATSNHPGGTACDWNWRSHAFQAVDTFNPAQRATIKEIVDFYEGMIGWAGPGYWRGGPVDEMHWQLGANTYDQANDRPFPKVFDFIARKIRPDGFSTFRRGGTVTPAPPASNGADVLARATGLTLARATEILPTVQQGLQLSQCTNPNRIAMWLAQMGHESASFVYTEEIAKNGRYAPYIGRTWIQITWDYNYRAFSEWCHDRSLVPTPDYFVVNYRELADLKWAGIGPAWYWTVSRPQINALSDARNLTAVTQAINGGQNGAADRKTRYDRSSALGDQLLALTTGTTQPAPTPGDDDLSAEAERMIREMYDEYRKEKHGPSRSFLATDGSAVESPLGFLYNIDGNVWTQQLTWAYLFDVPLAVDVVTSVAKNGAYEGSWVKSNEFNAWLNEFGQAYCQGLINFKGALVGKLTSKTVSTAAAPSSVVNGGVTNTRELADAYARIASLQAENARLQVAAVTTIAPTVELATQTGSTGEQIGKAYDALESLRLADALPIEGRAPLAALIGVLQTKNGSHL